MESYRTIARTTFPLIRVLVMRELRSRYKVTFLGFVWSLLRPVLLASILWIVGHLFLRFEPYYQVDFGVFLIVGILPWTLLSGALNDAASSYISNAALIRKVYFPRIVFPLVSVAANLVNFLLAVGAIFGLLALFGYLQPGPSWLLLPAILLVQLCLIVGLALLLSVSNVYFRDTAMILEFLLQGWFYLTPIFYPIDFALGQMRDRGLDWLAVLFPYANPMVPITYAYRRVLLGPSGVIGSLPIPDSQWPWQLVFTGLLSAGILLLGLAVHRRFKGGIADEV